MIFSLSPFPSFFLNHLPTSHSREETVTQAGTMAYGDAARYSLAVATVRPRAAVVVMGDEAHYDSIAPGHNRCSRYVASYSSPLCPHLVLAESCLASTLCLAGPSIPYVFNAVTAEPVMDDFWLGHFEEEWG